MRWHVAQQIVDGAAADQLEAGDLVAEPGPHVGEKPHGRRRITDADPGRLDRGRAGKEPQHRARDDAEGAFRANEEVAQRVAGVVLAQVSHTVPDATVGEHHLEAEHEVAGVAVAQHLRAAGIGREIAADLRRALRPEREREEPVVLGRDPLHLGEHDTGVDR